MKKSIQTALIVLAILSVLLGLFTGSGLLLLLLVALPIGITQYAGSLIDVCTNGKKSKYLWHLIWSTIVLTVIFGLYITDGSDTLLVIGSIIGFICLPVYYWILVFDSEWDRNNL